MADRIEITLEKRCTCKSDQAYDTPIHGGQSTRRDCAWCGKFLDFPKWYGKEDVAEVIDEPSRPDTPPPQRKQKSLLV